MVVVIVLAGPFCTGLAVSTQQTMGEHMVKIWDVQQTREDIHAMAGQYRSQVALDANVAEMAVLSTLEAVISSTCTPILIITNMSSHLPVALRHVYVTSTWHGLPGQMDGAPHDFETLLCARTGPTPETCRQFVAILEHSAAHGAALNVPTLPIDAISELLSPMTPVIVLETLAPATPPPMNLEYATLIDEDVSSMPTM